MYTKQPARVSQILKQVYVDSTNVDEDLVASILYPAQDPNAAEVTLNTIIIHYKDDEYLNKIIIGIL